MCRLFVVGIGLQHADVGVRRVCAYEMHIYVVASRAIVVRDGFVNVDVLLDGVPLLAAESER